MIRERKTEIFVWGRDMIREIIDLQVLGLELMKVSGEVNTINSETNADLLPLAALSLGSLGVILSVRKLPDCTADSSPTLCRM